MEGGAIDLDSEIGGWLDDLPGDWRSFTIHQLLTHTTGLRDHLAAPAKPRLNRTGARPEVLIELIAGKPLLFRPGTSHSYSNTGYVLLGMLIEKVSGRSYSCFLEEEILRPLELMATHYDSHSEILLERASGYTFQGGRLQNADFLDMSVPYAAGGLVSTAQDLLRWNLLLHKGKVLTQSSYQRMITLYPETQKADLHYGYGLYIGKTAGRTCLSHSGGVNGFVTVLQYYPELEGSLIVLSNLFHPAAMQPIVQRISDWMLN